MSDGPHRSLPLRRHWKKLAEWAATPSFSPDEVAASIPDALLKDFKEVYVPLLRIREIFVGDDRPLFHEYCADELEAVRHSCRGVTVGNILVDCAIQANADGLAGDIALKTALINALLAHARGNCHSIEEHYQREAPRNAVNVRARLRAARDQVSYGELASGLITSDKAAITGKFNLAKHTGIDEGPQL